MVSVQLLLFKPFVERVLTLLLYLAVLSSEYGLYLSLGFGRGGEVEPFGFHVLRFRGEHLHLIAALQLVAQWHELVVHLGADAVRAEHGVDGEGEVEDGRSRRHGLHLTLRREDEYLRCEQVELDGVEEVHGVGLRVVEDLLDGGEPVVELALVVLGLSAFLVFPVGGEALLCDLVHSVGADLHLYPLSLVRHHRHVEGLVAVGLRVVHPVAQPVGVALVDLVQSHIDLEAVVDLVLAVLRREDDADGEDVVDLLEGDVLVLHLAPDGVGALDTLLDVVGHTHLVEHLPDGCGEVVEHLLALFLRHVQLALDGGVLLRVLIAEGEVFQLGLDLVQSQAVGQRRIDIERLSCYLVFLVGGL